MLLFLIKMSFSQTIKTPDSYRVFLYFVLREWDSHPRPPGYEPGELLLLHPAQVLYNKFADQRKFCYFHNNETCDLRFWPRRPIVVEILEKKSANSGNMDFG